MRLGFIVSSVQEWRNTVRFDLPALVLALERHAGGARPEIDIGFTEGLTPPLWVDALTQHFRESGYEVVHNTPYVGVVDAGGKSRRDDRNPAGHRWSAKWHRS